MTDDQPAPMPDALSIDIYHGSPSGDVKAIEIVVKYGEKTLRIEDPFASILSCYFAEITRLQSEISTRPTPPPVAQEKACAEVMKAMAETLREARYGLELRGAGYDEWVKCDDALSSYYALTGGENVK